MAGDPTEFSESDVMAMAMRFLGRREHARQELLRKLTQRGVDEALAGRVIDDLAEQNLQSELRYAEAHARQRVGRGYGASRIRMELRGKGIDDALIGTVIEPFEEDWYTLALDWARRKHRGALDEKARARLYRGGMNRGFTHDQVMRAIDQLRSESADV
jgi:regulatory protein